MLHSPSLCIVPTRRGAPVSPRTERRRRIAREDAAWDALADALDSLPADALALLAHGSFDAATAARQLLERHASRTAPTR